jgi:hypothetical protein
MCLETSTVRRARQQFTEIMLHERHIPHARSFAMIRVTFGARRFVTRNGHELRCVPGHEQAICIGVPQRGSSGRTFVAPRTVVAC